MKMLKDDTNEKYRKAVELLYLKCQEIQTENERFVHRLSKVKRLMKRRIKDVAILKSRLDRYNDGWRHVPMVAPHRTRKTELKRGPKPKPKTEPKAKVKKQKTTEKSLKQKILNASKILD